MLIMAFVVFVGMGFMLADAESTARYRAAQRPWNLPLTIITGALLLAMLWPP